MQFAKCCRLEAHIVTSSKAFRIIAGKLQGDVWPSKIRRALVEGLFWENAVWTRWRISRHKCTAFWSLCRHLSLAEVRGAQTPRTRSPGRLNFVRRRLIFAGPHYVSSCHHSGAKNFEMISRFSEILRTPWLIHHKTRVSVGFYEY